MKQKEWVGTREAADLMGVSQRTIQKWVDSGLLKSSKTLGGHRRLDMREVVEYARKRDAVLSGESPAPAEAQGADNVLRVVLVEDDPAFRQLCQLQMQGFRVPHQLHIASNGYQGMRMVGAVKPHLLLSDLRMPGIDGFDMIRELRTASDLPDMRIVVITGMDAAEIFRRGGLPEEVTVLPKPLPLDILENIFQQRAATLGLRLTA